MCSKKFHVHCGQKNNFIFGKYLTFTINIPLKIFHRIQSLNYNKRIEILTHPSNFQVDMFLYQTTNCLKATTFTIINKNLDVWRIINLKLTPRILRGVLIFPKMINEPNIPIIKKIMKLFRQAKKLSFFSHHLGKRNRYKQLPADIFLTF